MTEKPKTISELIKENDLLLEKVKAAVKGALKGEGKGYCLAVEERHPVVFYYDKKAVAFLEGKQIAFKQLDAWLEELERLLTTDFKSLSEEARVAFSKWFYKNKRDELEGEIASNDIKSWREEWDVHRVEFVAWLLRGGKK